MTHALATVSCRQVSDLVADVFQKIFVHLWRALKNLALIKRWNSYVKLMPSTYVLANVLSM